MYPTAIKTCYAASLFLASLRAATAIVTSARALMRWLISISSNSSRCFLSGSGSTLAPQCIRLGILVNALTLLGLLSGPDTLAGFLRGYRIQEALQRGISDAQLFGSLAPGDIAAVKALQNISKTLVEASSVRYPGTPDLTALPTSPVHSGFDPFSYQFQLKLGQSRRQV